MSIVIAEFQKNFQYIPKTLVKPEKLVNLLSDYPNKQAAVELVQGFTTGFNFHYKGSKHFCTCTNLLLTGKHLEELTKKVNKELRLGKYLGPFKYPPVANLQCSPLSLVPKKRNKVK